MKCVKTWRNTHPSHSDSFGIRILPSQTGAVHARIHAGTPNGTRSKTTNPRSRIHLLGFLRTPFGAEATCLESKDIECNHFVCQILKLRILRISKSRTNRDDHFVRQSREKCEEARTVVVSRRRRGLENPQAHA
jgi:hypothetical protein